MLRLPVQKRQSISGSGSGLLKTLWKCSTKTSAFFSSAVSFSPFRLVDGYLLGREEAGLVLLSMAIAAS
eukprot:3988723-Ditylum_brightwellii.AAC.1